MNPLTFSLKESPAVRWHEGGNRKWLHEARVTIFLIVTILCGLPLSAFAVGGESYVSFQNVRGSFPLSVNGKAVALCVSSKDYSGIRLIAEKYFSNDIQKVSGVKPEILIDSISNTRDVVLIGTIGKNPLLDRLISEKKIDVHGVAGEWEATLIQSVNNPFPGVTRALIIAGSDKRGTIYGMFAISSMIGVSPWYWWADVPIAHHENIYVLPGRHVDGPPSVKYRGIFLNDEWPDLTNWVAMKYGYVKPQKWPPVPPGVANYGHEFYERIFELLLRLKANYLWPAMWNNAFNEDDTLNPRLANEYGIVMGTSHQEPMLRAQKEWDRRYMTTLGPWNFAKDPDTLEKFWRDGIRRNKNYESIVTIGLRGENDTPMAHGGLTADTTLLRKIINVQEKILADEMNSDVTKIPQLWCPYKEVLNYYNAGFRVPDYVTILWTDDNWGNLRRLPTAEERKRPGGAGIYYHFDYHGGPRNYQWINTDPIPKIWDQMSLAKEYGADRIWIVNVGHLKGYELPISFFMDYAWNTKRWTNKNIGEYTKLWSAEQFGGHFENAIAEILSKYSKYNGRIKPELLSPSTYSLVNYREWETVVDSFKTITDEVERIYTDLPSEYKDAFYELVLFPTKASYILNDMYYAAGLNELYASQKRAATNKMAERTRKLFAADTSLMGFFNRDFAGGKWDHFMDQPFIGYTSWNQPSENNLDAVHLKEIEVPDSAIMGIAVEGSVKSWPSLDDGGTTHVSEPVLPVFAPYENQSNYIDVFNRGSVPFKFSVKRAKPFVKVTPESGTVNEQQRVFVKVNWKNAPKGSYTVPIYVMKGKDTLTVYAPVNNPERPKPGSVEGFVENDGYVSIEACHYTQVTNVDGNTWMEIPDYGKTLCGMRATAHDIYATLSPGKNSPALEYRFFLFDTGKVVVNAIFSPTLNFLPGRGLEYGISMDGSEPRIITLVPADYNARDGNHDWEKTVITNSRVSEVSFDISKPGYHTVKIWMVDPGVVLEKIVVNCGGMKPSFLGSPESFHRDVASER